MSETEGKKVKKEKIIYSDFAVIIMNYIGPEN